MLNLSTQDHSRFYSLFRHLSAVRDQTWLVGGTVRDLLIGQRPADYDIAFLGDISSLVRSWARQQGGSWFWLDRSRNQSRVVLDHGRLQFDFAPLRAKTIEEDLRLRDFTVNAIAVSLTSLPKAPLIDPLQGEVDLHSGVLRVCSEEVLTADPLRCLKGIRHHAQQGWDFTPETVDRIRAAAPLLSRVAGERLRAEFSHILAAPHLISAIRLIKSTGLSEELFPSLDVNLFRTLFAQTLDRLDELSAYESIRTQLETETEELMPLRSLLYLSLLLKSSKQSPKVLAERLRLSRKSQSALVLSQQDHVNFELEQNDGPRIRALKLERAGRDPIIRLIWTLLQRKKSDLDEVSADAIVQYDNHLCHGRVPDLVPGEDLLRLCPSLSGQEIGTWMEKIKLAEINKKISSQKEALDWLEEQFSN